jgi:hypothetical protein
VNRNGVRHRRHGQLPLRRGVQVAVVAAVMTIYLAQCGLGAPEPRHDRPTAAAALSFGTLVSDPSHSTAEAAAGVRIAMVEMSWKQFEPRPSAFDRRYIRSMREAISTLVSTGRSVTLGLGLQDAPEWLFDLPDSRFVNQDGETSVEPNFVFNQLLRDRAEKYLGRIASEFNLETFDSIRLTSGATGEILYPGAGDYWAFDRNALTGAGLPLSMSLNPAPDWRPGDDWLDDSGVSEWVEWYVGGLNDVVDWQIAALSRLGFRGVYQILTPGVGLRPFELDDVLRQRLPVGLLGVGAAWQLVYSRLPRRADLMAYVTSVGDGSGGNDICSSRDEAVPLTSPIVGRWSAARWISRLADEYGFRKGGENPGWHLPASLDSSYRDTSDRGMMVTAARQARSCGFEVFYWAHDEQLWDGTLSFEHLARTIRRNHG